MTEAKSVCPGTYQLVIFKLDGEVLDFQFMGEGSDSPESNEYGVLPENVLAAVSSSPPASALRDLSDVPICEVPILPIPVYRKQTYSTEFLIPV